MRSKRKRALERRLIPPVICAALMVIGSASAAMADDPVSASQVDAATGSTDAAADTPVVSTIPVAEGDAKRAVASESQPEQAAQRLEDVMVTATKREKSVRDVPVSINAIQGEQLEKMGARDIQDYIALTPGITLQEGQFGDVSSRNITIRGVGSAPGTNQAVGQFIGDIPMTDPYSNFTTPDLDAFDLKTVEILKGPQGTYFGASALNGAIRYVPNTPDIGQWNGRGFVDYLSIHEGSAAPSYGAALNVPLGDQIALRGMGVLQHTPGLIDNLQQQKPDADSRRKWSGRGEARWESGNGMSVNLTYLKQQSRSDDILPVDNPNQQFTNDTHPGPSALASGFSLAAVDVRDEIGDLGTLVFQGSHQTKNAFIDSDAGLKAESNGVQSLRAYFNADIQGNTAEVRLVSPGTGNWNWIVGGFLMAYRATVDLDEYVANTAALNALSGLPIVGGIVDARGVSFGGQHIAPLDATEHAVFGEISRRLWDDWEVTAGLRAYRTRETGQISSTGATAALIGKFNVDQGDQGLSPKLSLAWKANDNIRAYATVSRGFQFGGVNASTSILPFNNPVTGTPTPPTFTSSTLWNREIGIRTDWLDKTLRADITYFNLDWDHAQFNQTQVNLVLVNTFVSNVGKVHAQGIDSAFAWITPIQGLSFNLAASYTQALTQVSFTTGDGDVIPTGTQMPATPRWQTSASATYSTYFGSWVASSTLTDTYSSKAYSDIQHSNTIYDASLLNLDFSVSRPDWSSAPTLAIGINNLTDKREVVGHAVGTSVVSDQFFYVRPRSLNLRLTAEFK